MASGPCAVHKLSEIAPQTGLFDLLRYVRNGLVICRNSAVGGSVDPFGVTLACGCARNVPRQSGDVRGRVFGVALNYERLPLTLIRSFSKPRCGTGLWPFKLIANDASVVAPSRWAYSFNASAATVFLPTVMPNIATETVLSWDA